jgi:hypothetical protein
MECPKKSTSSARKGGFRWRGGRILKAISRILKQQQRVSSVPPFYDIVGNVEDGIFLEDGLPSRPGFVIQQEDSSPTLTLVFEDKKTAETVRKR